jgi:hypothetical protein
MLPLSPCHDTQHRQLLQILALTVCILYSGSVVIAVSIDSSENNRILADRFESTLLAARYKERMIHEIMANTGPGILVAQAVSRRQPEFNPTSVHVGLAGCKVPLVWASFEYFGIPYRFSF